MTPNAANLSLSSAAAPALVYDDLPEGSELRREYDGRGGVTIMAPAGELPISVRRAVDRAGLFPASVAMALCVLVVGSIVLTAMRSNRLDPSLRTAAWVTLGVMSGGVFLLVWLTHSVKLCHALADARRQATVLHADRAGLLIEISSPPSYRSLDIASDAIRSLQIVYTPADPARPAAPVPCLRLELRDGTSQDLLAGHHVGELRWVAAALSDATGARLFASSRLN